MFERFTEKAIKAIMLSQEEARRLGHNFVGTEQILLGLIGEGTGIAAYVLKYADVYLKDARTEVEKIIGRGSGFVADEIPFTPRGKRIMELSLEQARLLGHNYIGTEHILLGLIREGEGVALQVLNNLGVDLSNIRNQVIRVLNGENIQAEYPQRDQPKQDQPSIFERFTEKAIKVIMLAQEESSRLGHNSVGTEQILLGLIGEGTGIAAQVLKSEGVNLKYTRIEVEKIIGRGSGFVGQEIPFTPRGKKILELSFEEARQLGHNYIGTEHLLLGLIREGEGVATIVLANLGVDLSNIPSQVIRVLNGENIQTQNHQQNKGYQYYNSSKSKLTISDMIKAGLIDTLAECFYQQQISYDLLLRISFPKRYQPHFHKFNNSFEFWQDICVKIDSGILDGKNSHEGFQIIVEEAMSIYKSNSKLREIHEKFFMHKN